MDRCPDEIIIDRQSTLRVGLVDDDATLHCSLRRELATTEPGWQLDAYTRGDNAWQALQPNPPELMLLARTLPDGCGLEWLRRCKRQWPSVPVVILTNQGCVQTLWAVLLAGAQGYYVKGGQGTNLVTQLRRVLEGKLAL